MTRRTIPRRFWLRAALFCLERFHGGDRSAAYKLLPVLSLDVRYFRRIVTMIRGGRCG